MDTDTLQAIQRSAELLRGAGRVLAITGAGISADSGLPTYRGIGGLYNDDATEDGIPIEMALAGEMLHSRPEVTWKYLSQVESACRGAGHNAAHQALVDLEAYCEVCVLTQNIDGFHRSAGSSNLIEMHGCFDTLECMGCGRSRTVADYSGLPVPPRCDTCDGIERPRVVLFGEMLPQPALAHYYRELERGFDVVLSIGTTSVFPYIAGPVTQASHQGIPTIEINPGKSEVSHVVDIRIAERAALVLPQLVTLMKV